MLVNGVVLMVQAVMLVLVAGWLGFNKKVLSIAMCGMEVQMLSFFLATFMGYSMFLTSSYSLIEEDASIYSSRLFAYKLL
ncbi:MAG: hypothetical protein GXO48_03030 [Chlorobi bacterium]|nr:hypothetical protein [Chlorobiota bacterium]